jgi:hypothetical protein
MNLELNERQEWLKEFDAAARRSLRERMRYSFIYTYKPVLDDAPHRSFNTMHEYRQWCRENLPEYLGYW